MKKIVLMTVALVATTFAFGQRTFEGEKQVNAGLGLVSSGWGVPIYASLDYGVMPEITVGGLVSYSSKNYTNGNYSNKGTWISIGAKADYHFNTLLEIPNEWDFYGGAIIAYNSFSYSKNWTVMYNEGEDSSLSLGLQVGGRYYFNENWAVNAELGGGTFVSGLKIGVTYKF